MAMLAVVVPAKDEASRIGDILRQVLRLSAGLIVPVINGSTDGTEAVVKRTVDCRIRPLIFSEALGYDVPRIAGAEAAINADALAVLFVDGDLSGRIEGCLTSLGDRVRRGVDLALCDCYEGTEVPRHDSAASRVYHARTLLNRALNRPDLGAAIPSHGPVAVSRRLLETVSAVSIGVPPLMQAEAALAGLRIEVAARIPHAVLGSAQRDSEHRLHISETIIGDCLQGICLAQKERMDRRGHLGYHPKRRFDLVGLQASAAPAGGGTPPRRELPGEVE